MKCVSLGSFTLNFPVVADIPLGTELCQVHELVCGYGEVEYLTEFYRLHGQRRPDVGSCQGVPQRMGAVVGPDTPIVVGVALGVFAVLVVQEGDDFVQHRLGYRKAGAEHGPGELEGEIGTDASFSTKFSRLAPAPELG